MEYFNKPKCQMFQCMCGFFTLVTEEMDIHLIKVHRQSGVFDFDC